MRQKQINKNAVLILTPFFSPGTGGVETHLDDLCNFLTTKTNKTYVLTYRPITARKPIPYKKHEILGNVTISRKWWPGGDLFHRLEKLPLLQFIYISLGLSIYTFFFMFSKRKEIKSIHAHGLNAAFVTRLIALIFPVKKIASTHAIYNFNPKSIMAGMSRWIFNGFSIIHALSIPSKKELIKIGVKDEKIIITYYWINHEVFKSKNEKNNLNPTAIFVGRLYERKGLKIIMQLSQLMKNYNFMVIGDGPMTAEINEFSKAQTNLEFIGKVNNSKLPEYYNKADFLLIPSLYEEGLGRVIIEALYCGLPVIGTNRGGIPEAIDHSVGIITGESANDFKQAIEKLFSNNNFKTYKKNTTTYAHNKFGLKNAESIYSSYFS